MEGRGCFIVRLFLNCFCFVSFLFVLVLSTFRILLLGVFFLDLEASVTEFTSKPSDPCFVLEGQDITVDWSYTLDGEVGSATFNSVTGAVKVEMGKQFRTGNATLNQKKDSLPGAAENLCSTNIRPRKVRAHNLRHWCW